MGDYQFLKLRSIEGYLCFVMCAHIYLTHQALDELDEKETNNISIPLGLVGIGQAKKLLCRKLFLDLLEYIRNGKSKKTFWKRFSLLEL